MSAEEAHVAATGTGTAPIKISLDSAGADSAIDDLLAAMLRANARVSDLIFSPGSTPQVQVNGTFTTIESPALPHLTADDTRKIAAHLIGDNKAALAMLREKGYCDVSYAMPGIARFRANVFIQRGSCAVVMRVIPTRIPTLDQLGAPDELRRIATLRDGLVLITGPRGSGKSSTLAALIDHINDTSPSHIVTVEYPIEFLHTHKRAIVHQRELHSDTPTVADAISAALRQAPNIIVVGELKDRETTELALEAAETGHLVLSTMATLTAAKSVERLINSYSPSEHASTRERLSRMLRWVICQRLIPRVDGERVALFEVVHPSASFMKLRPDSDKARSTHKNTSPIDSELERLAIAGIVTRDAALMHALDPAALSSKLSDATKPHLR